MKFQEKTVFEMGVGKTIDYLAKDYESLRNNTFTWNDIEVGAIDERNTFLGYFSKFPNQNQYFLTNATPLEQMFPLKFIDMITDYPNYNFGLPIYNSSLLFYTHLLDFFSKFYLEKDFSSLEKIEATEIESMTPIARYQLRKINRENEDIRDKYFNQDFNLLKFAIKCVQKFIPGATWRWIGGNHKAHIHSVKICKILVDYGLLDDNEIEQLKEVLYQKVQILRFLEDVIDRDSKSISNYWVKVWIAGLTEIRELYAKILVHNLYQKIDNRIAQIFDEIADNKDICHNFEKNQDKIKEIAAFHQSTFYEDSFARKLLYCFFDYVLSENKVSNESLINTKTQKLAYNFLQFFYTVKDFFLQSLRMMNDDDFTEYLRIKKQDEDSEIVNMLQSQLMKLDKITEKMMKGQYLYQEQDSVRDIHQILLSIIKSSQLKNSLKETQYQLFKQRIISNVFLLTNNCIEYIKDYKESQQFLDSLKEFLVFSLKDNSINQSVYLQESFPIFLKKLFEFYSEETIDVISEIFKNNSRILTSNFNVLKEIFFFFYNQKKAENNSIQKFHQLTKILQIIEMFLINEQNRKHFNYLPRFDLEIAKSLGQLEIQFSDLDILIKDYQENEQDNEQDAKLQYYMTFFSVVSKAMQRRFFHENYKTLKDTFQVTEENAYQNLFQNLGIKNLHYRKTLLELIDILIVDFKNCLLNSRNDYYQTKPVDMQYEEDSFYLDELTIKRILLHCKQELEFLKQNYDSLQQKYGEEEVNHYSKNYVWAMMVKLMNFLIIQRDNDIQRLKKNSSDLEALWNFLQISQEFFFSKYQISPQSIQNIEINDDFDTEIAKIEQTKRRENFLMRSHCMMIRIIAKKIMESGSAQQDLLPVKRILIKEKDIAQRLAIHLSKLQLFSDNYQDIQNSSFRYMEKIRSKYRKNQFVLVDFLAACYEQHKVMKLTQDSKKNYFLVRLNDISTNEQQTLTTNFCSFIHDELKKLSYPSGNESNYFPLFPVLIEILCVSMKNAPKGIHDCFWKAIKEGKEMESLNNIWVHMKWQMNFVRFKTNLDIIWKESYQSLMVCLKLHQLLCLNNNQNFKHLYREKTLPSDSIDRIQRYTTIFQKFSDNCEWHHNYYSLTLEKFKPSIKAHLFPICAEVFKCLARYIEGPCLENQKKIYTYIYDRYNGILKRFCKDIDSSFHNLKDSLLDFILGMSDGFDPTVIQYQIINFELSTLSSVMINSVKLLYFELNDPEISKKNGVEGAKISDHKISLKDFDSLIECNRNNQKFANHDLLEVSKKLFYYINILAHHISMFDIYCKERMVDNKEEMSKKIFSIDLEEVVVFNFLKEICNQSFIKKRLARNYKNQGKNENLEELDELDLPQEVQQKILDLKDKMKSIQKELDDVLKGAFNQNK